MLMFNYGPLTKGKRLLYRPGHGAASLSTKLLSFPVMAITESGILGQRESIMYIKKINTFFKRPKVGRKIGWVF